MKKLLLIASLFISAIIFADIVDLHKPQIIGQNNRNQQVSQGLVVGDTLQAKRLRAHPDSASVITAKDSSGVLEIGCSPWCLRGNSGTSSATNFIGTTDNVSLNFNTYGRNRMIIDSVGQLSYTYNSGSTIMFIGNAGNPDTSSFYVGDANNTNYLLLSQKPPTPGINNAVLVSNSLLTIQADSTASFKSLGGDVVIQSNTASSIILNDDGGRVVIDTSVGLTTASLEVKGAIAMRDGNQSAGKVMTSDANGLASWQGAYGTPTKDSIAATGGSPTFTVNSSYVITSAGSITTATFNFPTGKTGDWILVVFNKAIATVTNAGTGSGTIGLVAPLLGTSKIYLNIGGNWY
jgi:hypothetical protein